MEKIERVKEFLVNRLINLQDELTYFPGADEPEIRLEEVKYILRMINYITR